MKKGERRTSSIPRRVKKKDFDCVEMKRKAQAKIHRKTKGMTREEEVAYWNRPADGPLEVWWRSIQAHAVSVRENPPDSRGDTTRDMGPRASRRAKPAR